MITGLDGRLTACEADDDDGADGVSGCEADSEDRGETSDNGDSWTWRDSEEGLEERNIGDIELVRLQYSLGEDKSRGV